MSLSKSETISLTHALEGKGKSSGGMNLPELKSTLSTLYNVDPITFKGMKRPEIEQWGLKHGGSQPKSPSKPASKPVSNSPSKPVSNSPSKPASKSSDYTLVRKIDKGVNRNVSLVKKNGKEYISKVNNVNLGSNQNDFDEFLMNQNLTEIDILTRLRHPNLLRAVEFIVEKEENNVVFNLILDKADGDLSDYIESTAIPFRDRLRMIHQLGSALNFLRSQHMIHCDIKHDNILVKKSEGGRVNVWLSDFGLTRSEYSPVTDYDYCQTDNYRAPEYLYRDLKYWPYASGPNRYVIVFKEEIGFPGGYSDKRENVDLIGGEIWTFAWNALLILYNTDIKNFEKQIIANNGPRNIKFYDEYMDGYHYFIDILVNKPQNVDLGDYFIQSLGRPPFMDLEDPEDIETASREEGGKSYMEELLLVLRELALLLDLNVDTRPRTLANFLECKTFCEVGLQCGITTGTNHPYINNNDIRYNFMDIGSREINNAYPDLVRYSYAVILAAELFHRVGPELVKDKESMKYTAISCLILGVSAIIQDEPTLLKDWVLSIDGDLNTLEEVIIQIIRITGGRIFDVSLYDLLPSAQLLGKAVVILKNRKRYEELGGVSGIADYLLKEETPDEIQKKTPT